MGPVLLLVAAACFGTMGVFGKLAYEVGVSPGALLLLRFALAAVVLTALAVLRPDVRAVRPASAQPSVLGSSRRSLALTALGLGSVGYAIPATLYFTALQRIDASMATLIFYTYPVFVTLAAAVLGRDRLTPARCAALAVASCGLLLVLLGTGRLRADRLGVAFILAAAATFTVYVLVADRVVHHLSPLVLSASVNTGASLALAAYALGIGGLDLGFGLAGWLWITCMAVVSSVVGMLAFAAGLRRTGPATAAILSTFEPVVTAGLAALALGEFLAPVQLAGGLLVLSSVAVLQLKPRTQRRSRPTEQVESLTGRTTAP